MATCKVCKKPLENSVDYFLGICLPCDMGIERHNKANNIQRGIVQALRLDNLLNKSKGV